MTNEAKRNKDTIEPLVRQKIEEVMGQRDEVLRAFIAKYGFEPDRAIQIAQRMPDGTTRWFVRRRTDSDALLACPFCGQAPIKFGNETTCECDNKACGIYGVAVEVELWQVRNANR